MLPIPDGKYVISGVTIRIRGLVVFLWPDMGVSMMVLVLPGDRLPTIHPFRHLKIPPDREFFRYEAGFCFGGPYFPTDSLLVNSADTP